MPELPEVEMVRRGLEPVLTGALLTRAEIRRPDLRFPFPERFVSRLTGARIRALERRGKYILAPLSTEETLILHLGMSGQFVIGSASDPPSPSPHAHVVFETDSGARVTYVDPRRFGFMDLEAAAPEGRRRLAALGPDPFDPAFDAHYLRARFARRRQAVKVLLMDQSIVAGVGNIYASEALHRAGLRPSRPARKIARAALARLVGAVQQVLEEAIASGGSTIRSYAGADGAPGYFQHRFAVYGRLGEPCPRRACAGAIRRSVQAGRATYYCPACQS